MHRFFSARIFRAAPTLTALALMCLPFAAAQAESAFEAVEQSTEVLLKKLAEVQPMYEESPEKFYTEVDKALAPYIDFESFSRGVMAKHYRKATKQQRHTFQQSFRLALVKTYARSLVEFDNERVVVLPPKRSDLKADKATIKLEIHSKTGNIFPVQYQLVRRDGKWLLRNLIVGGINIGLQFRSQFGAFMQRYRNDIDKVIANWSVDV